MTDLQRNQPHGDSGRYHQNVHQDPPESAEDMPVGASPLPLVVTPPAARALLALLVGVHRKRHEHANSEEKI